MECHLNEDGEAELVSRVWAERMAWPSATDFRCFKLMKPEWGWKEPSNSSRSGTTLLTKIGIRFSFVYKRKQIFAETELRNTETKICPT